MAHYASNNLIMSKSRGNMTGRNILITGGAGFIGSHLASALVAGGYNVTVLDNLTPQVHGVEAHDNAIRPSGLTSEANFIFGTVTCREDIGRSLTGIDTIVHLAAETGTGQSMYEIDKYVSTNIGGTGTLLDVLANEKHDVRKVVVASSRSIYGEGKYSSAEHGVVFPPHRSDEQLSAGGFDVVHPVDGTPLELLATDEDSAIHPSSVYGITKHTQESLVMTVCPTLGIAPVALRFQNVYGPGQSLSNPYTGILSIFSTLIQNDKAINVFEDGLESRDFVYVDDVVDALLKSILSDGGNGHVLNVGSGTATTVNEVVETLQTAFGKRVPVTVSGNYRLGDIRHNYADLKRANEQLGFSPSINLKQGLRRFVYWVQTQGVARSTYEESLQEMRTKNLLK